MAAPDFALAHAAQRKQLADMVAAVGWRLWSKVDRRNISSSWMGLLASLIEIMTGTQKIAAAAAEPFTAAATAGAVAEGVVAAGSFAGMASDGRNLVSLLFQPVITALDAIKGGASVDEAMVLGGTQLEMINRTQVADAGRTADQVALIARPEAAGYIRIVVGDTCSRCIILAGRWYSYSEWFERHPNCDCIMLPAPQAEAAGLVQDPREIYEDLTRRQRYEAGWTAAEQEAIDEGADIIAVTNARRGVYTAGGRQYTREGTTRRGVYGGYTVDPETGKLRRRPKGRKAPPRLTPQQIFEDATDRDEAIRLLREHGYLLGTAPPPSRDAEPESSAEAIPDTTSQGEFEAPAETSDAVEPAADSRTEISRESLGKGGGGLNGGIEIITYSDGSKAIRKSLIEIELSETVTAEHQMDASELAHLVGQQMGLRVPAIQRDGNDATIAEFMDGEVALKIGKNEPRWKALLSSPEALKVALFDAIIQNDDRNDGNWLIGSQGSVQLIDHDLAFLYEEEVDDNPPGPFRNLLYGQYGALRDNRFTTQDFDELARRFETLRPEFEQRGREDWLEELQLRLSAFKYYAKGTEDLITATDRAAR